MSELTKEQCEEIREREKLATAGPWRIGNGDEGWFWGFLVADTVIDDCPDDKPSPAVLADFNRHVRYEANSSFVAHAKTDIPNLLDTVASLRAKLENTQVEHVAALKRLASAYERWLDDFIADSELGTAIGRELDAVLAKLEAKQ